MSFRFLMRWRRPRCSAFWMYVWLVWFFFFFFEADTKVRAGKEGSVS